MDGPKKQRQLTNENDVKMMLEKVIQKGDKNDAKMEPTWNPKSIHNCPKESKGSHRGAKKAKTKKKKGMPPEKEKRRLGRDECAWPIQGPNEAYKAY